MADQEAFCSFCDQPSSKVKKLIANKSGVHICNYCVALCYDVMLREGAIVPTHSEPLKTRTDEDPPKN